MDGGGWYIWIVSFGVFGTCMYLWGHLNLWTLAFPVVYVAVECTGHVFNVHESCLHFRDFPSSHTTSLCWPHLASWCMRWAVSLSSRVFSLHNHLLIDGCFPKVFRVWGAATALMRLGEGLSARTFRIFYINHPACGTHFRVLGLYSNTLYSDNYWVPSYRVPPPM